MRKQASSWRGRRFARHEKRRQRKNRERLLRASQFEPLETRQLMFATSSFSDGLLVVRGSADHDSISVFAASDAGIQYVRVGGEFVWHEGVRVNARDVNEIRIEGGGGNDTIDLSNLTAAGYDRLGAITVRGGAGHDLMRGSGFGEVFEGGLGNDRYYGGGGNNTYRFEGELLGIDSLVEQSGPGLRNLDFHNASVTFELDCGGTLVRAHAAGSLQVNVTTAGQIALTRSGAGHFSIEQFQSSSALLRLLGGETSLEGYFGQMNGGVSTGVLSVAVEGLGTRLNFNATQHLAALNIGAGAQAVIPFHGTRLLTVNTLSMASIPAQPGNPFGISNVSTGALDLQNNSLVVRNPVGAGGASFARLRDMLLTSVWVANDRGIRWHHSPMDLTVPAVVWNEDEVGQPFFTNGQQLADRFGQALTRLGNLRTDDVLVLFTYAGDAFLDRTINFDDYVAIDSAFFGFTPSDAWVYGDFNYDGQITFDDYIPIDTSYFFQSPLPIGCALLNVSLYESSQPQTIDLRALLDPSATGGLTYGIELSNPAIFASARVEVSTGALTLSPAPSVTGSSVVNVRALNVDGLAYETVFEVTLVPAPPATSGIPDIAIARIDAPQAVALFKFFEDLHDRDSELLYSVVGTSNPALFSLAPASTLNQASGVLTLNHRANAAGKSTVTVRARNQRGLSADATFTVTVGDVVAGTSAPRVEGLRREDEASTAQPTLVGRVANISRAAYQTVEFDVNGDAKPDGTALTDQFGGFSFAPTNLVEGANLLRWRVKHWTGGEIPKYTDWSQPFEVIRSAAVEISVEPTIVSLQLTADPNSDRRTNDSRVSVQVANWGAVGSRTLEFDTNGDGEKDAETTLSGAIDSYTFSPTGLSHGRVTIRARIASSESSTGWTSITFVYTEEPESADAAAEASGINRENKRAATAAEIERMREHSAIGGLSSQRDALARAFHQNSGTASSAYAAEIDAANAAYEAIASAAGGIYKPSRGRGPQRVPGDHR